MTTEKVIKILSFTKQIEDMLGEFDGGVKNSDLSKSLAMAIEALQKQPCDNCISREALIERINHEEENFKSDHMESISSGDEDPFVDGVLSGIFNLRQMVKQAPSVTPQASWIPVAERLPLLRGSYKMSDDVLITNGFETDMGYLVEREGKIFWHYYAGECEVGIKDEDNDAIAWTPLPQPYKVESEDKE